MIREEQRPLMPHNIHALVSTLTSETEDASTAGQEWNLISKWCIMASQKEGRGGNSILALQVDAVTEEDEYLG